MDIRVVNPMENTGSVREKRREGWERVLFPCHVAVGSLIPAVFVM